MATGYEIDTAKVKRVDAVAEAAPERLASDEVWKAVTKASFAVLGYVTPEGEPRTSGVVYKAVGSRLCVAVDPDGWKARHIAASGQVSVTATVRRGGLLSLVFPIPPATVSFHGSAIVHPPGSPHVRALAKELGAMLPEERQASCSIIEIIPDGVFVTYGIGVPLMKLRDPEIARCRVPVE